MRNSLIISKKTKTSLTKKIMLDFIYLTLGDQYMNKLFEEAENKKTNKDDLILKICDEICHSIRNLDLNDIINAYKEELYKNYINI